NYSTVNFGEKQKRAVNNIPQNNRDTYSTSHINYRGLFLAGLLTLAPAALLSGCTTNTPSVPYSNVREAEEPSGDNIQAAIDLQSKLFSYGNKLTVKDTEQELNNFFKNNSINNVNIDDINNPADKTREDTLRMKQALAAFWSVPDDNIDFKEGTLYIDKNADLSDEIQRMIFICEVTHEATHALQLTKDTSKQGLNNILDNTEEAKYILSFLNNAIGVSNVLSVAVQIGRNAPLSEYAYRYLNEDEKQSIKNNEQKYRISLYDKPVNIERDVIDTGIQDFSEYMGGIRGNSLEETVNIYADYALDLLGKSISPDTKNINLMRKALLSNIIYTYRSEAEAHKAGNFAIKKAMGLDDKNILLDYIPASYDIIADILQNKLDTEFQ
ncbi:hypothetical protein II906_07340, partial [bacterium]|nr:hypothetical protein [bacterium]